MHYNPQIMSPSDERDCSKITSDTPAAAEAFSCFMKEDVLIFQGMPKNKNGILQEESRFIWDSGLKKYGCRQALIMLHPRK